RLVPRRIMMGPVAVLCRRWHVAEERMRLPSGPASTITIRSAEVFRHTEMVPSRTNWKKTCPLARLTNCGMNDRKNRAVLGLSTSVATPCHKGLRDGLAGASSSGGREVVVFSLRASRIIRTPRKHKYAAPTYLTAAKASADLARIVETPKAAEST